MKKPYLLVVTGRLGSGKTTFAGELGSKLSLPVVLRDALKEGYVHTAQKKHSDLPSETNRLVTDLFFQTISSLLNNNISLIAEAAFQHKVWEPRLESLSKLADIYMLICRVEPRTARERFLKRGQQDPTRECFHGDLFIEEYETPDLPYPTTMIDTTSKYTPSIDEIKSDIFNWRRWNPEEGK